MISWKVLQTKRRVSWRLHSRRSSSAAGASTVRVRVVTQPASVTTTARTRPSESGRRGVGGGGVGEIAKGLQVGGGGPEGGRGGARALPPGHAPRTYRFSRFHVLA